MTFAKKWDQVYISKLLGNREYDKVITHYKGLYNDKSNFQPELAFKIADLYAKKKDYTSAIEWYQKEPHLLKETKVNLINMANTYKAMGNYQKAFDTYQTYLIETGDADKVANDLELMERLIRNSADVDNYAVDAYTFNTKADEMNLGLLRGNVIYLQKPNSLSGSGKKAPELLTLQAQRAYDKWKEPSKIIFTKEKDKQPLNFSFTKDGNKVVFSATSTMMNDIKSKSSTTPKEDIERIYTADFLGGQLLNITPFPYNSEEYSCANPSYNADGTKMYFASTMQGGLGEFDIYESSLVNGKWSKPKNLGKLLNSKQNDNYPFYMKDRNSNREFLYFSSNRDGNFGGYDIYRAELVNSTWEGVQLLSVPINTAGNENSYIYELTSQTGYVSSDRTNSVGGFDIYRIKPLNLSLIVRLKDSLSREALDYALIELLEKNNKINEGVTNIDGERKININTNKNYTANISKEGYRPKTVNVNTEKMSNGDSVVLAINLFKDTKFDLKNSVTNSSLSNYILFTGNFTDASTNKLIKPVVKVINLNNNKVKNMEFDNDGSFNMKLLTNNNYKLLIDNQGIKSNDQITTIGLEHGSVKTKKYVLSGTKFKTTENSVTQPALVENDVKNKYFNNQLATIVSNTTTPTTNNQELSKQVKETLAQTSTSNNIVQTTPTTNTINEPIKSTAEQIATTNTTPKTSNQSYSIKMQAIRAFDLDFDGSDIIYLPITTTTPTEKTPTKEEQTTTQQPIVQQPTTSTTTQQPITDVMEKDVLYKLDIDAPKSNTETTQLDNYEVKNAYLYKVSKTGNNEDLMKVLKGIIEKGYYLAFILQDKDENVIGIIK